MAMRLKILFLFLLHNLWVTSSINNNISIPVACTPPYNIFPFCNTSLSTNTRINNIISLLNLTEKANLLTARQSPAIHRLGIPAYNWGTNCIHSVLSLCGTECPSAFPLPNGLGASFNKSLIYNISVAIALEFRSLYLQGATASSYPIGLDCWGPTINIGRDPRWGRMYEVVSEDPYWNGIYGTLFTLGLQNGSIDTEYYDPNYYFTISTLKHLAAYSLGGYQSFTFNAIVSDYMFADTYYPPFIITINNSNPKGIMCSYNAINNVPACVDDKLLNKTLRQKWKFNGYISSDSGAIKQAYSGHHYTKSYQGATELAIKSGVDIDSGYQYKKYLPSLVINGNVSQYFIDKAIYNSFKIRFDLGLFDQPISEQIYFNIPPTVVNSKQHKELNLFATYQVMTLLKNDNKILPFNPANKNLKYAVIGPHYNASAVFVEYYIGQVCKDGTYSCIQTVLNGLKMYVNTNNILYCEGCNGVICNSTAGFINATKIANGADIIILMMGLNKSIEYEGIDRTNISLPGYQQLLAQQICKLGKPTVLVLVNGGIVAIDNLKYLCPAILEIWYPGFYGSKALIDTLFGLNNPSAKLAVTMYWSNFTLMASWNGTTAMDLTANPYGRTYKYWSGPKPLFPFGYGLSYTVFKFEFYNDSMDDCDQINKFCIQITNIGNMNGYETIFVFIYMPQNTSISNCEPASKMIKKLVEFDKIYLEIGNKYIFKWIFNKSNDLIMYNVNGTETLFVGNYTIQFSNGVEQNLNVKVQIDGIPNFDNDCENSKHNKYNLWSNTNIVIGACICSIVLCSIVYLFVKKQKLENASQIENNLIINEK